MPGESCRTGLTRPRPPTGYVRRSFVLPVSTPYDRRHGVCVARMRAVNRAFSLERVLATRQTRLARDEAEPLPRADVGDFRRRLWERVLRQADPTWLCPTTTANTTLFAWGPRPYLPSPSSCAGCTTPICAPSPRRSSSD